MRFCHIYLFNNYHIHCFLKFQGLTPDGFSFKPEEEYFWTPGQIRYEDAVITQKKPGRAFVKNVGWCLVLNEGTVLRPEERSALNNVQDFLTPYQPIPLPRYSEPKTLELLREMTDFSDTVFKGEAQRQFVWKPEAILDGQLQMRAQIVQVGFNGQYFGVGVRNSKGEPPFYYTNGKIYFGRKVTVSSKQTGKKTVFNRDDYFCPGNTMLAIKELAASDWLRDTESMEGMLAENRLRQLRRWFQNKQAKAEEERNQRKEQGESQ